MINCIVGLKEYYTPVSMEFYDAEDEHFVQKCLNDVASSNIYILILGKRYGYIPKDFTKSITELEYEKAVECQKAGKPIQILVFKVGDLCDTYKYEEKQSRFVTYQQGFLDEVSERLSPKPFDSEAELQLQVSNALMKRLFKLIRKGERVIPPDKDSVLCFCDRINVIGRLKRSVTKDKKRLFFLQGNRLKDYPGGIVKRFARFSMGSENKIEPLMNITELATSCDSDNSTSLTIFSILEYVNRPVTDENTEMKGFVEELGLLKSKKVILPFYYNILFDTDFERLKDFFCFLDSLFAEYNAVTARPYDLYLLVMIYSDQPDFPTVTNLLAGYPNLQSLGATIDRLKPVSQDDILDWLEAFISGMEQAPSIYQEYFGSGDTPLYPMQDVNIKLGEIIDDLSNSSERIKKYL
jgi:hypothetical protein